MRKIVILIVLFMGLFSIVACVDTNVKKKTHSIDEIQKLMMKVINDKDICEGSYTYLKLEFTTKCTGTYAEIDTSGAGSTRNVNFDLTSKHKFLMFGRYENLWLEGREGKRNIEIFKDKKLHLLSDKFNVYTKISNMFYNKKIKESYEHLNVECAKLYKTR